MREAVSERREIEEEKGEEGGHPFLWRGFELLLCNSP